VAETALAKMLVLTAEAKQWDVVTQIAGELETRGITHSRREQHSVQSGRRSAHPEHVGKQSIDPVVVDVGW
jgi:hypothetical protein